MSNGVKKILYIITQSELGGAQRYVFDLATNLQKEFNISVAAGEPGKQGKSGDLVQMLKQNGFIYENKINRKSKIENRKSIYTLPHLKRAISPINDFLALIEIVKLIKKIKPDIIHLNSSKVSILGSLATAILKLTPCIKNSTFDIRHSTFVYTVHGWVFNEPLSSWKKSFYFWAEKFTSYFKDRIICISKLDYDIAKNLLNIKEGKLTLIHHGIEPIKFLSREQAVNKLKSQISPVILEPQAIESRGEQLSRDSIGRSAPSRMTNSIIIGTIANLYKTKGLEYFIEAIKILKTSYKLKAISYKLIIIGEGKERKNIEKLIKKYDLQDNIILAGKIENAASLLTAFDIYVSSSVKEGFPYNILEAMSAGLPIVATRVGGVPEMIINGKNGLLVEPKSPQELARKIKTLIGDGYLRDSLSVEAMKDVKEKFTIEKMIEKTKGMY